MSIRELVPPRNLTRLAYTVVLLFGLISTFGDLIYEGARSVNAPYLRSLGVSVAMVGVIAGLGEFLGYVTRLVAGYLSDRTRAYWVFAFLGYGLLASVPMLGMVEPWYWAAVLMILERFGKALRTPAKDTILSMASKRIGTGLGFGIHEALDQFGGVLGPLVFTVVLSLGSASAESAAYRAGYVWFWLPFTVLLVLLMITRALLPNPETLEPAAAPSAADAPLGRTFWLYNTFTVLATLGFVGWPLLSYHFVAEGILDGATVALLYAISMGVDGLVAVAIGWTYDRLKNRHGTPQGGLGVLVGIPVATALQAVLGFLVPSLPAAIAAAVLWGVVMGTHETIMKSAVADLTGIQRRGIGFGVFNTTYGVGVLVAGVSMGFLYEVGPWWIVGMSAVCQAAAMCVFLLLQRSAKASRDRADTAAP